LESDVVLVVQLRSSVMCTPRNLVLLTLSTVELLIVGGRWSVEFLLKSITTSCVFFTLRDRLIAPHSVKSSGLSTYPCEAPVLSVVLEVLWPTRTD